MKHKFLFPLVVAIVLCSIVKVQAAERFVSFTAGDLLLNPSGGTTIFLDAKDMKGVSIAAGNLCADLKKVTDADATITASAQDANILVGTLGHSSAIDNLVKQKVININALKGKREKYIITIHEGKLVIAGSDRRGTIYGIYELSRQIGVSPWYYWADVPVEKHGKIYVRNGIYTDGEPAVRYRGLFLNDEAPCLTSWVKNTFGTNYGDHHFYAKVFELILRLKGNYLWPAMWSWAFYADDPENSKTADEMGVVMGTSHHEPMARNHQEWARHRKENGAWNYNTNQTVIDKFFREGIERMKGTEDIVTIGMRGDGDEAMSEEADTKLLQKIVGNQRKIIEEITKRPAKETPQLWALYKEVQDYYDAGMRVPEDVTMLLCDDNWGNVRRVPNAKERQHKGGWGLYYHVDYVGAPRNTKWLNVTQTQQMFEQLTLAYDHGIDRIWILNVGDLKPMEYPIQLFMDMAWNPKEHTVATSKQHTVNFFTETLGESLGLEAAEIYNRNCQYAARVTAEMLDSKTYNVKTGEWKQVCDDYARLERNALRLFLNIPEQYRDFYNQLVLFPIQAMSNLYDMYYAQAMNHHLSMMNNPDAVKWAKEVERCFKRDAMLCESYNKDIAGGKWNGMMTQKHIGYKTWNDDFGPADVMPEVKMVDVADATGGYLFHEGKGYISMEAEHWNTAVAAEGTQWTVYPDYGRTRSGVALTPYTVGNVKGAALNYSFLLPAETPEKVKVHVIVKSTLDYNNCGGHECELSIDGCKAETVNFNRTLVDRQPYVYSEFYPAVARRVVEKVVELPVGKADVHTLTLRPQHPGIVFEKIVIDYGGYSPSYLFMEESGLERE